MSEEPNFYMLPYVLKALYASEINCGLSSFWDGGFTVWIGDDANGRRAETTIEADRIWSAAEWLTQAACHLFPNSEFGKLASGALGASPLFEGEHCLPTHKTATLSVVPKVDPA